MFIVGSKQMKKILLVCLILGLTLFGCGSDSSTSGTLTMSDIALTDLSGSQDVSVTATYLPEAGKSPIGVPIHFVAVFSTSTNTDTRTANIVVDSTGKATYGPVTVVQGNEAVSVRLTASYGGLSQTKSTFIPALQ